MKEKILKLREHGMTYSEISEKLGCSKSTISYHLNTTTKEKSKERITKRKNLKLEKQVSSFQSRKLRSAAGNFGRGQKRDQKNNVNFNYKDVIKKFGENTECYLKLLSKFTLKIKRDISGAQRLLCNNRIPPHPDTIVTHHNETLQ